MEKKEMQLEKEEVNLCAKVRKHHSA